MARRKAVSLEVRYLFLALTLAGAAAGAMAQAAPGASGQSPTQAAPQSATPAPKPAASPNAAPSAKQAPAQPAKKVDLNNATLAELKTLPMVGDAEAKKIVANRPYKSKGELVTKAGLPEGVYHAIKRKVEMQAPRKPAAKK